MVKIQFVVQKLTQDKFRRNAIKEKKDRSSISSIFIPISDFHGIISFEKLAKILLSL